MIDTQETDIIPFGKFFHGGKSGLGFAVIV